MHLRAYSLILFSFTLAFLNASYIVILSYSLQKKFKGKTNLRCRQTTLSKKNKIKEATK